MVTLACAARSLMVGNAGNSSKSALITAIASENTLSEFRWLRLYTKAFLLENAHRTRAEGSVLEYDYVITNVKAVRRGRKRKQFRTPPKRQ